MSDPVTFVASALATVGIITQDMRKIIDSAKLAFVPTV